MTAPVWRAAIRLYEGGLKRRPIFRYWEELERSQWLPAADVAAIKAHESSATVPITNNYDITRNGIVNAWDATDAAASKTSGATAL